MVSVYVYQDIIKIQNIFEVYFVDKKIIYLNFVDCKFYVC